METVEERKANVAQVAGVDLDKVAQVRLDIGKMLDAGLLIDIDLHGFSCLKAGVSWEELGIGDGDDRKARMSTGVKYLAPAEVVKKLTSLEVRFRQCLDKYSFDVEGFKPWRWLPFTAYESWRQDWQALNADLNALKAEIIAAYENITDENRRYFEQVAGRAWKSYQSQYVGEIVVQVNGRVFETYEAFENYIVTAALAKMPKVEFIAEGIYGDYKTGYLVTPPEIAAHYARLEAASAEAAKLNAEAQLLWQKEREKDLELTARQLELKAKADAVRQAELEHTRQQLQQITSPLQEVVLQFRTKIYESVVSAAKSIQKSGGLRGKTAEMLKGLQSLYNTLAAATDDTELETALASLQNALDKTPVDGNGKYDVAAVEQALAEVTALTEDASYQLARQSLQSSRAAFLELE